MLIEITSGLVCGVGDRQPIVTSNESTFVIWVEFSPADELGAVVRQTSKALRLPEEERTGGVADDGDGTLDECWKSPDRLSQRALGSWILIWVTFGMPNRTHCHAICYDKS